MEDAAVGVEKSGWRQGTDGAFTAWTLSGEWGRGGRWFVSGDPKSGLDPSNERCQ